MIKKSVQFVCSVFCIVMIMPHVLFAAEVIFKTSSDPLAIDVRIDPQGKELNVVEGAITFSGIGSDGLSVQIENGQSILPIWPTPPLYDASKKSITFTGGIPNGFSSEGLLFRLRLVPASSDDLTLTYVDGSGYLNDGKGTKIPITSTAYQIYAHTGISSSEHTSQSSTGAYAYAIIGLIAFVFLSVIFKYVFKKNYTP